MKVGCHWQGGLAFTAGADGHSILMDAKRPLGKETGLTPKELVLAALCGCTAMDVASLLRKYRQTLNQFDVSAEADVREGHPATFSSVMLKYSVKGEVEAAKLVEAVQLSQSRYCAVSAMVSKSTPIHYQIELNGEAIHSGASNFS